MYIKCLKILMVRFQWFQLQKRKDDGGKIMTKKTTTIIFDSDVVDSMKELMKAEDRKDFGPSVNIILRRYFNMRNVRGVNEK